jgi:hypothetical protein
VVNGSKLALKLLYRLDIFLGVVKFEQVFK